MLAQILQNILERQRLTTLFQPILDLKRRRIIGYEALMRGPSDSPLHAPAALLAVAERCGRMAELDRLCRKIHIRNFVALRLPGRLFLNVFPATLMVPDSPLGHTRQMLADFDLTPDQVVIELTEHYPVDDFEPMRQALAHYRRMGFSVAIDDLGAGYSSLRLWSEVRPDFVKFDRHFIQGIDTDPAKGQFIRSMQEIAAELDCRTIAEGMETESEYRTVAMFGVDFGQGYYFARPEPLPIRHYSEVAALDASRQRLPFRQSDRSRTVSCLIQRVPSIEPHVRVNEVADLFAARSALKSLPVVGEGGIPVGLVFRHTFMNMLGSRFGRDLYGRESIVKFMAEQPVIIEKNQPLEEVSQVITGSGEFTGLDDFIIAEKGRYVGIGTVLALLREITDLQIQHAQHANPLTLLPGNVPINEHLEHLLQAGEAFAACYCDLDHFKPFNDHYGYRRGDQVICLLGRLLQEEADHQLDFIGHIGGDDFMAVFRSGSWLHRCRRVIRRFDEEIKFFYDAEDRRKGGLSCENRDGSQRFFPFVGLSIGAVHSCCAPFESCHAISTVAAEVKHQAKKVHGSYLFVDRRFRRSDNTAALPFRK
jgi:EAL domain-containing protein (putative c-di-GMP-specific phosphodiesterase class I)/GGDEF domain-containing protein